MELGYNIGKNECTTKPNPFKKTCEQIYTCGNNCANKCTVMSNDDIGEIPSHCLFDGTIVKWIPEFNEHVAITELESRGYVCIKKTREE